MDSIKVFAPATVANVSCAFDVLGFAINEPGDTIIMKKNNSNKLKITSITGDDNRLPYNPEENVATVAIKFLLDKIDSSLGFDIELHKNMPIGSGLGSSAASSAAAVFALNLLLDSPFSETELVKAAMEGERVACGSPHADNVAPSIMGGFILIRSYDPLDLIKIPVDMELYTSVLYPNIIINTEDSRKILQKTVPLKKAISQWGNIAALIYSLINADKKILSRSLEDYIITPERGMLIPGFKNVINSAKESGALGGGISGSGPSIFALSDNKDTALKVGEAMKKEVDKLSISSNLYVSPVNFKGPKILE